MTIKDWKKAFKQLKAKPVCMKKYVKHNAPKVRTTGMRLHPCARCGRFGAHNKRWGLKLCRTCFRDVALKIGFKKYN